MANERELLNVTERCRLCLLDNGFMISLHDELVESKLKDLTKCTCIDIKQEKHLPHSVCHICLYKLNMWTEFKEQFIQSNRTLFKQLQITEVLDDTIKDCAQNEEGLTEIVKRKRLYQSSEDSNFDIDKKKSKLNPAELDTATSQFILDTICITDTDDVEPASSKDSSQKVLDIHDNSKEQDEENGSEEHTEDKSSLEPRRARLLPAKRGRNIKQRQASTKRWVERKKALFAATGEDVSDSDSIISDERMTPVQKARAKTNEDKEAERQKRIAKVLKDLETNTAETYTKIHDGNTDSDTSKTRLRNEIDDRNGIERDTSLSMESSMEQISAVGNNITANGARKIESQADDETFVPQSSKTELMIGDTKFIVTSQLIPGDSSYEETLNDLKRTKGANIDGSSQEKNTDIIDAVQLRRVNPVVFNANSKFVKRCLDIRIEGHEWLVLKRVQMGLSDFIQKEVKYNLLGINGDVAKNDKANSRQDLDQKLKDLIQKTIQKNVELSTIRDTDSAWDEEAVISPKKRIESSPEYQPKVMMKRLDVTKESKVYNINNSHALTPISRKRRSVPPIRYNDYSTALDSDSIESDDIVQEIPKTSNPRTYRNLAKRSPGVNSQIGNVRLMDSVETIKTVDSNATSIAPLLAGQESLNEQKIDYEDANKIEGVIAENHICGVCGLTFNSRKDVEAHVRAHKAAARASSTTQVASQNESTSTPPQPNKQKKMRCKRCHEIVEACYVKAHAFMCKMKTGISYKCYVCNSTFTTQTLLVQHLETHDQSEFDMTKIIDNKNLNADTLQQIQSTASPQKKMQNILMKKSDIQSDKIMGTSVKSDGSKTEDKSKETYNCFLCDKIFTDEEVLKDHLQKHCDDLSEGEENSSKEQYQCAICGDTLESDQALEEHVSKHLFNDEDNTNLINVNQDTAEDTAKSNKHTIYHCDQCSITFNSETSLKAHVETHIQEVTTEKYQQDSTVVYQYQCTLCEELFDTEEEMAEHLELHNGNAQVCQLCDKPFRTLEELQEHVATH